MRDATHHFMMSDRMGRFLLVLKRINKPGENAKKEYVKKCNKERTSWKRAADCPAKRQTTS